MKSMVEDIAKYIQETTKEMELSLKNTGEINLRYTRKEQLNDYQHGPGN